MSRRSHSLLPFWEKVAAAGLLEWLGAGSGGMAAGSYFLGLSATWGSITGTLAGEGCSTFGAFFGDYSLDFGGEDGVLGLGSGVGYF